MPERSIHVLIDAVDDVLLTTLSWVRDLTETDADLPSECPGWTVRDPRPVWPDPVATDRRLEA